MWLDTRLGPGRSRVARVHRQLPGWSMLEEKAYLRSPISLPFPTATPATTPTWIDKIVGWRNYAMTQQPTSSLSATPEFFSEPQHQAEFLWQLLALFRRSAIPNRQPVGQAACFNLSVHFRWELRLPGPGTRCQLADRSGFHDSAATFEAAPQRYPSDV